MAKEIAHGTRYAYTRLRCRCGLCKTANALYFRERRAELRKAK